MPRCRIDRAEAMEAKPTTVWESLATIGNSLLEIWESTLERIPFLVAGILVLFLTWAIASFVKKGVRRAVKRRNFRRGFKDLLQQLASVTVWIVGITIALVVAFPGLTPSRVLAGLGLSSIALGFAFKDIVENFLAGLLILWRFPFDLGDFVRWGEIEGKIEGITIRMTLIRRTNGELVVLPNAKLFKEPVEVLTTQKIRRITVICGVAYDEDVDESRAVIHKAVEACETVSHEQPIEIFAQEFASSSINFEVTWWCGSTPLQVRRSRDEVIAAVKRALDRAGIEIPFPYRTLVFKEPLQPTDPAKPEGDRQQSRRDFK